MESVATQAAVEVAIFAIGCLFALLIAVELIERFKSRPVKQPARVTNRISDREMQLVGDDYRDCVRGYFARQERRRQIVEGVCRERH